MISISRILAFGLFAIFAYCRPVAAHDGWVEISPFIVETNQPASIALFQGNHSNEHKSYRIAGKWDAKYVSLELLEPNGKRALLTDRLFDMGEDDETVGPKGPKGFHLAPFTPKDEGLFQVYAKQMRTLQRADGPKLVTLRTAKAAFASFKIPTVGGARDLKGFDRAMADNSALEFIPLSNPLAVYSGGSIMFEMRHKGKSASGQAITLVRRVAGFASVQEHTTDENGRVKFVVGPADSYLLRVKFDEETARPDGQKDKTSYESSYVFPVFNRP